MTARKLCLAAFLAILLSLALFLAFLAKGIFGGDSGDLVTAAYLGGVPHPPGYPLYTVLGFLFSKLAFSTPAWRIGVISSISHSLTVGLVFLLVFRLTKKIVPSIFSGAALIANYLFFLYAVTPEVFAMLDLFLILEVYLLILWHETKKKKYLYLLSLVFGLSLTHHQLILFLAPAAAYLLWLNKKFFKWDTKIIFASLPYFFFGLLPLSYIFLAGCGRAIVNWDQVCGLPSFVRLISRADYGTFTSGAVYGSQILSRFLGIKAYFEILVNDFTWLGIALIFFGIWSLFRYKKSLAYFFIIAILFLGPIFVFYASFPIFSNFNFATFERFLLPTYVLFYVLMGLGFSEIVDLSEIIIKKYSVNAAKLATSGLILVLFLFPFSMLFVTTNKFIGFPNDETADNLGKDILSLLPSQSILLVAHDTTLFTTQYVRYALRFRPDTMVIHSSILENSGYPGLIKKNFPELSLPDPDKNGITLPFIRANRDKYSIFSNTLLPLDSGWYWVPYGLVYKLTDSSRLPNLDQLVRENEELWKKMHDPNQGILSRYNHLMLGDVRNVYGSAKTEYARILLKGGKIENAIRELKSALAYKGDTGKSDIFTLLGLSELFLNQCQSAINYFKMAQAANPSPDKNISLYEAVTYRDCAKNASEAQKLFDEYEKLRLEEETPLRQ